MVAARLVVETLVLGVDFDPAVAGHGEVTHEGRVILRNLDAQPEAAGLGLVLHVPDLSAGFHQHLDAVAGVARGAGGVNSLHAVEVTLHGQVVLIAAASEQNALAGLDGVLGAVRTAGDHAGNFLRERILHEGDSRVLKAHVDAALFNRLGEAAPHAAVLEGRALGTQVSGAAVKGGAFEVAELNNHAAPLQLAAADIAGFVIHAVRHVLDPRELSREAVAQPGEVLIRNRIGQVAVVQIGLHGFHRALRRNEERLAGGDGVAARQRLRHLFEHENLGVRVDVMRLNGRRSARQAVADDEEIHLFVPLFDVLNRRYPVLSRERGDGHGQHEHKAQQQRQSFFHLVCPSLLVIHGEAKHGTGSWFCHGCAMFAPHFPSVGLLYILKRLETQACLRKNKQIRFQADSNPDFGLFVSKFAYSPFVSVFFWRFHERSAALFCVQSLKPLWISAFPVTGISIFFALYLLTAQQFCRIMPHRKPFEKGMTLWIPVDLNSFPR